MAAVQPSHADSLAGQVSSSCFCGNRGGRMSAVSLWCRVAGRASQGCAASWITAATWPSTMVRPVEAVAPVLLHSRQPQQQPHVCPTGASLIELSTCEDILDLKLPWQVMISASACSTRLGFIDTALAWLLQLWELYRRHNGQGNLLYVGFANGARLLSERWCCAFSRPDFLTAVRSHRLRCCTATPLPGRCSLACRPAGDCAQSNHS